MQTARCLLRQQTSWIPHKTPARLLSCLRQDQHKLPAGSLGDGKKQRKRNRQWPKNRHLRPQSCRRVKIPRLQQHPTPRLHKTPQLHPRSNVQQHPEACGPTYGRAVHMLHSQRRRRHEKLGKPERAGKRIPLPKPRIPHRPRSPTMLSWKTPRQLPSQSLRPRQPQAPWAQTMHLGRRRQQHRLGRPGHSGHETQERQQVNRPSRPGPLTRARLPSLVNGRRRTLSQPSWESR